MHFDVIVVGAGSMGMAAGYFLSKSGKRTLLLDSFNPPHTRGSHHGDTRIIRYAYGEGEEYVPLVLKAQSLWNDLAEESGKQIFLQTGVFNAGRETSEFIQTLISSAKKYSLPLDVMDSKEVHKRWPGITIPDDYIGCYEPTSGILKSEECITAYRELAIEHGAVISTNSQVHDISANGHGVTIRTYDNTFTADSLVISAGAWSGKLLSMLNLNLPLSPVRKSFAWFDTEEQLYNNPIFPAFVFETNLGFYYGFPSIEGSGLKVGRHDGGMPINPDENIPGFGEIKKDEADLTEFLNVFLPYNRTLKYGKTCIYTLTPDEDFIIDIHPDYPNIAIAAGFSGHGFKFSSVVGSILSDLILFGKTDLDISPFSIKRF